MEQLIKETGSGPVLSGYEKTAILLGELDAQSFDLVMNELPLNRVQLKKIRKAMKKLGKYNPHDYRQTVKETSVLGEMMNFFRRRNITTNKNPVSSLKLNLNSQQNTDVTKVTSENAAEIANILKTWLNEK